MFKRTLVVLEPRLQPGALMQVGVALARACMAEVIFYTPLPREGRAAASLPALELAAQWEARREAQDEAHAQAELLHQRARQLALELRVPSKSVIESPPHPVRGVLDAAAASHCDLVLVASDGSNALIRLLGGSLVPGLITASPIPVIVCPPARPAALAQGSTPKRVLVILEDGSGAGVALKQGLELARELAAELLFVHIAASDLLPVVDVAGFVDTLHDRLADEIQRHAQRVLDAAVHAAEAAGLKARGTCLPAGTTAREVAELAAREACEPIVVAHGGSNAVVRLLSGSLIPGLITSATGSVLIAVL
ncbi:MAG: universal stress protein [Rubrivivax sp.]|nr:universal stress protein [Rubrivivax sp.]